MSDFRELLRKVDRSYDGFVHAVVSYVKTPGNEYKRELIEEFIKHHPEADSSDVLHFMIEETEFFESYKYENNRYSLVG